MLNKDKIVINTSPLIALIAALNDLTILQFLYQEVFVPWEVCQEILTGGKTNFGITEFNNATWLRKQTRSINISPWLLNTLDKGEASVIQLALEQNISTVCIDEVVGRRIARLSGLALTGSIGILLKAKEQSYPVDIKIAIENMLEKNIRLSSGVINFALRQAGEI